jgi:hypothetical protein
MATRLRIRFGFDAFIAYNRGSAAGYARKLYEGLTGEPYKLVCFIDERRFKPGTRLRPRTMLTLLLTHMLIVVFTAEARASAHVRREVSLFLLLRRWLFRGRPVSILDVEGEWQRVLALSDGHDVEQPWARLKEEARRDLLLYEVESSFATGDPSAAVRERYGGWKRFERLRRRDIRVVLGSAGIAAVLTLVSLGLTWLSVRAQRARDDAVKAAVTAAQAQRDAERLSASAQQSRRSVRPQARGTGAAGSGRAGRRRS